MPLLGLFSKKAKKSKDDASSLSSPTTERSFQRQKRTLFGNNISTRSLPPQLTPSSPPPPLPTPAKRPGFFKWGSTKSSPPTALPASPPPPLPDTFNLRSFQHSSPSPPSPTPAAPLPRPRGASTASNDSSQRISVAAFREAQAKRSLAGSPRPATRLSSALDSGSDSEDEPRRPKHRKNSSMDYNHRVTKSEIGHGPKYTLGNRSTGALGNDNDDDDAPLASLVSRKPLVDISTLTTPRTKSTDSAFTEGSTLLASKAPPKHFVSPPHSPPPQTGPAGAPKHSASLDVITTPQVGLRKSPMRKDSSPSRTPRENLADRLNRISKASSSSLLVGDGAPLQSNAAGPPVANMNPHAPARFNRESMSLPAPAFQVDENFADLASMLGAGVRLISRNGEETPLESSSSESESDSDSDSDSDGAKPKGNDRINPIPIKQRTPAPSFSVTSRPAVKRPTIDSTFSAALPQSQPTKVSSPTTTATNKPSPDIHAPAPRPRSATLLTSGPLTSSPTSSTSPSLTSPTVSSPSSGGARQRSSTLIQSSSSSPSMFSQPSRPFAQPQNRQATSSPISSESTTTSSATKPTTPGSQDSLSLPHHHLQHQGGVYSSSNSSSGASSTRDNNKADNRGSGLTVKNGRFPVKEREKEGASYTRSSHLREGAITTTPNNATSTTSTTTAPEKRVFSGGTTGLPPPATKRPTGHAKRASVSFSEGGPVPSNGGGGGVSGSVYSSQTQLHPKCVVRESKSRETMGKVGKVREEQEQDERRKERRRNEAKAALEMGKFFNGKGRVNLPEDDAFSDDADDDDMGRIHDPSDAEDNQPISQTRAGKRISMMSGMNLPLSLSNPNSPPGFVGVSPGSMTAFPMTASNFGGMPMMNPAGMGMGAMPMSAGAPNPAYMLAAHNQAMQIAKQAYQIAAAQQAMAAAGEEWERTSTIGGGGGGGFASPPASFSPPSSFSPPYGMGMGMGWPGMPNMGVMGGGPMGMFPAASRSSVSLSVYGGGIAQSEYGGGGGAHPLTAGALNAFNGPNSSSPGWSGSKSVYGETFGRDRASKSFGPLSNHPAPPNLGGQRRESGYFPPQQPSSSSNSKNGPSPGGGRGDNGGGGGQRNRTVSQPANMHRPPLAGGGAKSRGGAPPPSSWKAAQQ